jgi:hypothetical protein
MAFLQSIEQIRAVNWGSKHTWDVRFDDAPDHVSKLIPPFTNWFPVTDISVDEANVDTYAFDLGNNSFEIPAFKSQQMISITFHDSENYTLFKWLRDWIEKDILNKDKAVPFVSRLDKVVKTIHITKQNSRKSNIDTRAYFVFPKGNLQWEGTSQPQAQQYTVNFVIAGIIQG